MATAKQIDAALKAMRETTDRDELQRLEDEFAGMIAGLNHSYLGPTWQKDEAGDWLLPERTLGWEVIGWCSEYLQMDDSTPDDFQPWDFTDEQMRFILWWYAIDAEEIGRAHV